MQELQTNELEVNVGGGRSLRVRGYDFLTFAVIGGMAVFGAVQYIHTQDTRMAFEQMNANLKELGRAQRETNCILALPIDKRVDQIVGADTFCKRIAGASLTIAPPVSVMRARLQMP